MAAANGHIQIIQTIFQHIDPIKIVNVQNKDGNTPLHWAVINKQTEVVKLLLSVQSDPNIKNHFDRTPLDEAIEFSQECADLLAEKMKFNANEYQTEGEMKT